jgi:hypothetical protein
MLSELVRLYDVDHWSKPRAPSHHFEQLWPLIPDAASVLLLWPLMMQAFGTTIYLDRSKGLNISSIAKR